MIVVAPVWEYDEFLQVIGEPMLLARHVHKAVFDRRGLGMKPHDLVAIRLAAHHHGEAALDQLLDQLRPRRLVLDKNERRIEPRALLDHRPLGAGIGQFFAKDVQQIEMHALDAPSRADGIVGELRRLVGGVPGR